MELNKLLRFSQFDTVGVLCVCVDNFLRGKNNAGFIEQKGHGIKHK